MEPRQSSRGNIVVEDQHVVGIGPSMEPRQSSRGNRLSLEGARQLIGPSMEPRQSSRGNYEVDGRAYLHAPLQWSRGKAAAETPIRSTASRGRVPFNGAAAKQPRKRAAPNAAAR